MKMIL
jgi:hypothetical protein